MAKRSLFQIWVVWTHEHGIEPPTFVTADEAKLHAHKLRELAGYRCAPVLISSITVTPTELASTQVARTF